MKFDMRDEFGDEKVEGKEGADPNRCTCARFLLDQTLTHCDRHRSVDVRVVGQMVPSPRKRIERQP